MKKLIVSALLLLAALGFFMLITEMPAASANVHAFCPADGKNLYCWISYPYWQCLTQQGGEHCVDPIDP
jgi:hypothetical protein